MSAAPPESMLPRRFRVVGRQEEIRDTFTLTLAPEPGEGELTFVPGQFTMLYVFGVGEIPVSISGDAARPQALVQTIRAVGAVSRGLERLPLGAMVGVRGPFGSAWPLAQAAGQDLVLVAGGLGMAPLRPAVYHAITHRADYGRVLLLVGARSPADILYREEMESWRGRGIQVEMTVDRVPAGRPPWPGQVGVITNLIRTTTLHPERSLALLCGPEAMMHFSLIELQHRGFVPERLVLSMERNMKCAIGLCGHCQFGTELLCRDGPVLGYDRVRRLFHKREI